MTRLEGLGLVAIAAVAVLAYCSETPAPDRKPASDSLKVRTVRIDSGLVRDSIERMRIARELLLAAARERAVHAQATVLRHERDSLLAAAAAAATAQDSARLYREAAEASGRESDSLRTEIGLKDGRIRRLERDTVLLRQNLDSVRAVDRDRAMFQRLLERDIAKLNRRPTWPKAIGAVLLVEEAVRAGAKVVRGR